jgi:hypothetical protein
LKGDIVGQYTQSGNYQHDLACNKALGVLQGSIAAATQNAAGQVTINNAEIVWARAVIASCKQNNSSQGLEAAMSLLRALGTGGV